MHIYLGTIRAGEHQSPGVQSWAIALSLGMRLDRSTLDRDNNIVKTLPSKTGTEQIP